MSMLLVLPSCMGEHSLRAECRLPTVAGELGSVCGFRNPEDLAYFPSAETLITAEFEVGGGIVAFSPSDPSSHPRTQKLASDLLEPLERTPRLWSVAISFWDPIPAILT